MSNKACVILKYIIFVQRGLTSIVSSTLRDGLLKLRLLSIILESINLDLFLAVQISTLLHLGQNVYTGPGVDI